MTHQAHSKIKATLFSIFKLSLKQTKNIIKHPWNTYSKKIKGGALSTHLSSIFLGAANTGKHSSLIYSENLAA